MRRRDRRNREKRKNEEDTQVREAPVAESDKKPHRDKGWVEENSPRHEAEYSGILSAIFHFCLLMVLSLISGLKSHENLPVAVDVIQVAEAASSSDSFNDDFSDSESLQATDAASEFPITEPDQPETQLTEVDPVEVVTDVAGAETAIQQTVADRGAQAQQIANALENLKRAVNNSGGGGGGGESGGGGGSSGRAGRAARWILKFDTRSPRHYAEQLEGLGAEVAFPLQGDRWRYYDNLTSSPPTASVRDLSKETRIYWIDNNPQTYRGVATILGAGSAPMMVAFLPVALENRMLEMELNYMGRKEEEDIQQTEFVVVRRGGKLDIQVQSQRLR